MSDIEGFEPHRIKPQLFHGYKQLVDTYDVSSINADFELIKSAAAAVSPFVTVTQEGKYVKWQYKERPAIYITSEGVYTNTNSLEAREGAGRVISILKSKGLAVATRRYNQKVRVVNEPARDLYNSLSHDNRKFINFIAHQHSVPMASLDEKKQKKARGLIKKGYLSIEVIGGKEYVKPAIEWERVEKIFYRERVPLTSIPDAEEALV